jgi:predicted XRE-type DNA-binding protein
MTVDKIRVRNWRDVKATAHERGLTDPVAVADAVHAQLTSVRAYRLADLRKAQKRTQRDIADQLAVAQSRVSAIENGDLAHTELGTVTAYVEALGGQLRVVADFGDQTITVE